MTTPALPPGFVLDEDDDAPALPPGFVMEQAPDFRNVTSGFGTQQGQRQPIRAGGSQRLGSRAVRNLGGERLEEGFIGLGRSMDRTLRGAKQAMTGSVRDQAGALSLALREAGFDTAADAVARNVAAPAARSSQAQMREESDLRALDAQFDPGGYVTAGDVVGTVGQLVGPGVVLRGTAAAPALLPRTIAGNALQGGLVGMAQPIAKEGERGTNTLVGTVASGAGAAIPRVVGAVYRGVRNLLPGAVSATDKAAGRAILSEATNPAALTFTPSAVSGVQRTLGDATLDPGLMALENTIRSPNSALFTNIDRANNAARMNLLQGIAGTDADLIAAESARDLAARGAKAQAMAASPVDIARTLDSLDSAIASTRGRSAVQPALQALRDRLASYADSGGRVDMQTLENVRADIGDMLAGKFGGDASAALRGARELIGVRDALNREVGEQVPVFTDYLNAYRQGSGPINRMEVGRELLNRAGAVTDPITGVRTLTPAQFAKATNDLDAVAAKATGFDKAQAAQILTPEDMASIRAINDDLARQMARANTRPAGSPTQGLQEATKRLAVRSVARAIPGVGGAVDFFEQQANQRVQQRLAYLVANPQEAQRVLAAMQPRDRAALANVLTQLSARGGVAAPALVPALAE